MSEAQKRAFEREIRLAVEDGKIESLFVDWSLKTTLSEVFVSSVPADAVTKSLLEQMWRSEHSLVADLLRREDAREEWWMWIKDITLTEMCLKGEKVRNFMQLVPELRSVLLELSVALIEEQEEPEVLRQYLAGALEMFSEFSPDTLHFFMDKIDEVWQNPFSKGAEVIGDGLPANLQTVDLLCNLIMHPQAEESVWRRLMKFRWETAGHRNKMHFTFTTSGAMEYPDIVHWLVQVGAPMVWNSMTEHISKEDFERITHDLVDKDLHDLLLDMLEQRARYQEIEIPSGVSAKLLSHEDRKTRLRAVQLFGSSSSREAAQAEEERLFENKGCQGRAVY